MLRRITLLLFVLLAPPLLTALMYVASVGFLAGMHRVIDQQILWYSAAVEMPIFLFFAVLEARSRW